MMISALLIIIKWCFLLIQLTLITAIRVPKDQHNHSLYSFQSYPFNIIGGKQQHLVIGEWKTHNIPKDSTILSSHDPNDKIQSAAIQEGYFSLLKNTGGGGGAEAEPDPKDDGNILLFTSSEARRCLQNKVVHVTGDSYMVQLTIGLLDILLNKPENVECFDRVHRNQVLHTLLSNFSADSSHNTSVAFIEECRHGDIQCLHAYLKKVTLQRKQQAGERSSRSKGRSRGKDALVSMEEYVTKLSRPLHRNRYHFDVLIANVLVHHVVETTIEERSRLPTLQLADLRSSSYSIALKSLFRLVRKHEIPLVWLTGPRYCKLLVLYCFILYYIILCYALLCVLCSHVVNATVSKYQQNINNAAFETVYDTYNQIAMELAVRYSVPLINIQPLTGLCTWSNCTTDRYHRARFVNRMKAQLLLNALCKLEG